MEALSFQWKQVKVEPQTQVLVDHGSVMVLGCKLVKLESLTGTFGIAMLLEVSHFTRSSD